MIIYDNGDHAWLVGVIDISTKNIRLDILPPRTSANLKIFFTRYIQSGTHIIHDGWMGYNFLDDEDSYWIHVTNNHGNGDFDHG